MPASVSLITNQRCCLHLYLSHVCWVEHLPLIIIYMWSILSYRWQWIHSIEMHSSREKLNMMSHWRSTQSEFYFALHCEVSRLDTLYSCAQILYDTSGKWGLTRGQVWSSRSIILINCCFIYTGWHYRGLPCLNWNPCINIDALRKAVAWQKVVKVTDWSDGAA